MPTSVNRKPQSPKTALIGAMSGDVFGHDRSKKPLCFQVEPVTCAIFVLLIYLLL